MVYRMIFNQTAYFGRGAIKVEFRALPSPMASPRRSSSPIRYCWKPGTVKKVTDVLDEAGHAV